MLLIASKCGIFRVIPSCSSGIAGNSRFFRTSTICLAGEQEETATTPVQSGGVGEGQGVGGVTTPSPRRSGQEASFQRGTGGRGSFSGTVATIFGVTGFTGKYIMSRLARDGTQMIIPYRLDPYWMRKLKVFGDVGQILFFPFQLKDENSIRKVMKYSNLVINLIGRDHESRNFSFEQVHVEGARRLARIAREMGVKRFIHVSAMNASLNPREFYIPGGSQFLKTKAEGELAVKEEFPEAVIVRPADMYGIGDKFLNFYGYWFRRYFIYRIDMHRKGVETYKMPLYVNDFAAGIHRIVQDPTLDGLTLEFVGPECYQLADIVDYFYRRIGKPEVMGFRRRTGYSPYFKFRTNLLELKTWIRLKQPIFNWEILERIECNSDILTGLPTLQDIGVKNLGIFPLASRLWVDAHSKIAYMEARYGEYPEPPEPTPLAPLTLYEPTREDVHVTDTKTFISDPDWAKFVTKKYRKQRIEFPDIL